MAGDTGWLLLSTDVGDCTVADKIVSEMVKSNKAAQTLSALTVFSFIFRGFDPFIWNNTRKHGTQLGCTIDPSRCSFVGELLAQFVSEMVTVPCQ